MFYSAVVAAAGLSWAAKESQSRNVLPPVMRDAKLSLQNKSMASVFSRPKNSTSSTRRLCLFNIIREFKTYQSAHSEMKRNAGFDMIKFT